jgi:hypothetical protein
MAERSTGKASTKNTDDAEQERLAAVGQTAGPADAPGPGSDEVQAAMDVATEQGFFGVEVDPVENHNYTVAGVTSGKPTPETDRDLAREIRTKLDNR